jgi:hypothetical protein
MKLIRLLIIAATMAMAVTAGTHERVETCMLAGVSKAACLP